MKGILKTGPVAVFIVGGVYMVVEKAPSTEWDLLQAMAAEEELELYRIKRGEN